MRRLIASIPATVVFANDEDGEQYGIGQSAYLTDETNDGHMAIILVADQERWYDLGQVTLDVAGRVEGETIYGSRVVAREYEPGDAPMTDGLPSYSVPARVVAASITGENADMHVEALVGSDNYVQTLLLVTDVGLWTRYAQTWYQLPDLDVIDGLESVPVQDEAVDLYDDADTSGVQVPIERMPLTDDTTLTSIADVYAQPGAQAQIETGTVAAAQAFEDVDLPVVSDARDLAVAVDALPPDPPKVTKWYLTRRRDALGADVVLPWEATQ